MYQQRASPRAVRPYNAQSAHQHDLYNIELTTSQKVFVVLSYVLVVIFFPFSLMFTIRVVPVYQRYVIFRLGTPIRGGVKGPGLIFVLPCIDTILPVDLRLLPLDVPPQEVLTKDAVTIQVDAVIFMKVEDPLLAVVSVTGYRHTTFLLATTLLRKEISKRTLTEILTNRDYVTRNLLHALFTVTESWGVVVPRVEIRDIKLPDQMQRAMAAEAEASRMANAKVIAAEGELKASRALKEASEVIVQSPAALQLRYLQTIASITSEKMSTVIFPLPLELFSTFTHSKPSAPPPNPPPESGRYTPTPEPEKLSFVQSIVVRIKEEIKFIVNLFRLFRKSIEGGVRNNSDDES